jgi:hypothetical protein
MKLFGPNLSKIPPISAKTNNHLSPQLIEHNKKKTTTYDVENPGPGLGQTQNVGFKLVSEILTLDNWISNDNAPFIFLYLHR